MSLQRFTSTTLLPSSYTTLIIGALLTLTLLYILYNLLLHPLSRIPGPFLARFSRLWIIRESHLGQTHRTMMSLHAKHGPLVRTGPNEVSTCDLTAIKTIYSPGSRFVKSEWYSVWQGWRKFDLFAERHEKVHAKQRAIVGAAYTRAALGVYESRVDEMVELLTEKMEAMSKQGKEGEVDVGVWLQLFAFDIIGAITFSRSFGYLEGGVAPPTFKLLHSMLHSAAWVRQIPWVFWLNDFLTPYIGNRLAVNNRHGGVRNLALKEVDARTRKNADLVKHGEDQERDILARLISIHDEKPADFNYDDVVSMATSNVGAGSDTTAISLRAIIFFLLKNPRAMASLMHELQQAKKEGHLSDPVQMSEAANLPYLQACLYEALRLHPAVGFSLPRIVPAGGITIAGTYIPAGTTVGANPWVVHRQTEIFGDDVEEFRPERWLGGADDARVGDRKRFFFAFGGGSRGCIGRNISWMEMEKLVPTLLMRFEMELVWPERELEETCWWFVMQKGLYVRVKRRGVS